MKLLRTAGPLGRKFGFSFSAGPFWISANAGHYILSVGWGSVANVYISRHEITAWIEGTDGFSLGGEPGSY